MKNPSTGGPSSRKGRPITPHKGGRSERINIRCTPEIRALLRRIKNELGYSAGDLLELMARDTANLLKSEKK